MAKKGTGKAKKGDVKAGTEETPTKEATTTVEETHIKEETPTAGENGEEDLTTRGTKRKRKPNTCGVLPTNWHELLRDDPAYLYRILRPRGRFTW